MKYLSSEQLKTNLSSGKPIEQWLSHQKQDDYTILKWLRIDKEKDSTYSVSYMECFDEGDEDFLDIYEFAPLDPDEPFTINSFSNINEALFFAINKYQASESRFVAAGMIQEEYKEYLMAR
ncbi:hypothetical protein MTO98_10185 [Mucilaginibacter sp. SMC90]|uniref:hypothetical protein n=1 Tax=Mucilaginibacter sp. SMC90 TaxID=2929803 RepID=UPI001FB498CA|nr:hypothetical protein [Mucilaginibacter sp. SMC90]UOE51445.1 hypothetical protein MTO98_10185 [Mucilaginibacter sp. SMC90]